LTPEGLKARKRHEPAPVSRSGLLPSKTRKRPG
jgi:hypothetical protein